MFHNNQILDQKNSPEKGAATAESHPCREVAGSLLKDVFSATEVDAENVHIQLLAMEEGKKILEKELDKIHNELLEKLRDIASGEAVNTELKTKIGALEQLNSDREKLMTENKDLEQLLADAKKKIDAKNIDIQQRLEEENLLLADKLKTCMDSEDVKRLQNSIQEVVQNMQKMHTSLSTGKKEIEKLKNANKKIPVFEAQLEYITNKHSICENIMFTLVDDLIQWNRDLGKKEDEIRQLKDERVELFNEIEEGKRASAAIIQLKQENILLQEQILLKESENASALNDLNSKLESLNLENDRMKTKCDEKDAECKLMEHELFSQRDKLKRINKEKQDFKGEIREKKKRFESEMFQAQNVMNQLQKAVVYKDHMISSMQSIAGYYITQMKLSLKSPMEVAKYGPCPSSLEEYSDMFYNYASKLKSKLQRKDKYIRTLTTTLESKNVEMDALAGEL